MLFETPNFVPFPIPPPGLTHGAAMAADPRNVLESNGATIQLANGGSNSGSSGRSTPNGEPAPGKLFVGGLSWQTTNEKLQEYFSKYGNVTDVLIMKDPVTQRSRGFGFITFENPASVAGVLKCNSHSLDGKRIDPKYATPKNRPKGPNRTKKIFVGGVSQDTTVEEVKAYFSAFGKVEEAVMLMDQQTKRHRGFGFVTFENEEPVETVCEIHYHNLKGKKVECKKAMPKDAVQANAQMLGKRIILNGLGMRMAAPSAGALAANSLAVAQAQAHAQAAAAAAAAAQVQNAQRIFGAYPPLAGYRYAPYAIPTVSAGAAAAAAAAVPQGNPTTNPGSQLGTPLTTGPYPGYSLANVDMSSFQGVDWSPMYSSMGNMGMY